MGKKWPARSCSDMMTIRRCWVTISGQAGCCVVGGGIRSADQCAITRAPTRIRVPSVLGTCHGRYTSIVCVVVLNLDMNSGVSPALKSLTY